MHLSVLGAEKEQLQVHSSEPRPLGEGQISTLPSGSELSAQVHSFPRTSDSHVFLDPSMLVQPVLSPTSWIPPWGKAWTGAGGCGQDEPLPQGTLIVSKGLSPSLSYCSHRPQSPLSILCSPGPPLVLDVHATSDKMQPPWKSLFPRSRTLSLVCPQAPPQLRLRTEPPTSRKPLLTSVPPVPSVPFNLP